MTDETPQDPDPGFDGGIDTNSASGCTNYGEPPANCIKVTGSGCSVSSIRVSIRTGQYLSGRWKVTRNGNLFLRSVPVVVFDKYAWEWDKNWTFDDGDILRGGFWLSTGSWFTGGPAAVTISC